MVANTQSESQGWKPTIHEHIHTRVTRVLLVFDPASEDHWLVNVPYCVVVCLYSLLETRLPTREG
jgi:hypothetical protein